MSPIATLASSHTISVLVDNEPGILARVVGLFSGRGYNIESLTVAETDAKENLSRITIVTTGTPMVIEQIKAQLDRLVPVHRVHDLTVEGPHIERELALVKVKGTGEKRVEALRLADVFRAKVIDAKTDSFVFEVTGTSDKVQTFVGLMERARPGRCRPHRHRRHDARRRGVLIVDYLVALLGLAVVHLLAVASPGPSTVLVIQTAAVAGRRGGLLAALAMMVGALAVGDGGAVRPAGAVRPLRLALPRLPHRRRDLSDLSRDHAVAPCARSAAGDRRSAAPRALTGWQGFLRALLLQLSNPKIMVFFGSIFLSVLPQQPAGLDGRHGAGHRGLQRIHLVRAARPAVFGRAGAGLLPPGEVLAGSVHGRRAGASRPAPRPGSR